MSSTNILRRFALTLPVLDRKERNTLVLLVGSLIVEVAALTTPVLGILLESPAYLMCYGFAILWVIWRSLPNTFVDPLRYSLTFVCFFALTHFILIFYYFGPLTFPLYGGYSGDGSMMISVVNRFADSRFWTDFNYKDLSPFYPSLYQFVLGRIATVFGIEPFMMPKFGMLTLILLFPLLLYWSWSRIVSRSSAALIAVLASLISIQFFLYKPYEYCSLWLFVPWWIHTIERSKAKSKKAIAFAGLEGGLLFCLYHYWFLLVALMTTTEGFYRLLKDERSSFRSWLKSTVAVLASSALVASPFLIPLAISFMRFGAHGTQNAFDWQTEHFNFQAFALFSTQTGVQGGYALVVLATAGILLAGGKSGRSAQRFAFGVLSWFFFSNLFVVCFKAGLQASRMVHMVQVLVIVALAGVISEMLRRQGKAVWNRYLTGVIPAFMMIFASSYAIVFGANPDFGMGQARNDNGGIHRRMRQMLEGKENRTFLTITALNVYGPVYLFNANPFYSHPAAQLAQRQDFLVMLAQSDNPEFVAYLLQHNRFAKVDYLYADLKQPLGISTISPFPQYLDIKEYRFTPKVIRSAFVPLKEDPQLYEVRNVERLPGNLTPVEKEVWLKFGGDRG